MSALLLLSSRRRRGAIGWHVRDVAGRHRNLRGHEFNDPNFEPVPPAETDFGFWPFIIDLDVDEERGVPLVAAILRDLWNQDLWAVAACSFEEKLPRSGGYRAGQLILTDE